MKRLVDAAPAESFTPFIVQAPTRQNDCAESCGLGGLRRIHCRCARSACMPQLTSHGLLDQRWDVPNSQRIDAGRYEGAAKALQERRRGGVTIGKLPGRAQVGLV